MELVSLDASVVMWLTELQLLWRFTLEVCPTRMAQPSAVITLEAHFSGSTTAVFVSNVIGSRCFSIERWLYDV